MNTDSKNNWRTILSKSLSEPRRFFFWLSLVSLFVLFMTLLFLDATSLTRQCAHWVGLAGIIGFIIGLPAFLLSWIPPLRGFFTGLLRHKLFCLVCIVTLVALFYAVENWRGRTSWANFQREWEAKGVSFDVAKIIPPPVRAEENMFEAQPWTGFHFTRTNGVRFDNTNIQNDTWLDVTGPNHNNAPKGTDLFTARRVNLLSWQEFYRGSNNVFATVAGSHTNYFPVAESPQSAPQDVLLALSRSEVRLEQIREAGKRPAARFWIDYEEGLMALLPHLAKVKANSTYLRLRAEALLAENKTGEALGDTLLAFRLGDAIRDEPTLISQLVRIAEFHITLSCVWEGLLDHRWSDEQLKTLGATLAKADFLADYQTGMNGERCLSVWAVDYVHRSGEMDSLSGMSESEDGDLGGVILSSVETILYRLAPTGWFDQNKLSLGRTHVNHIRPLVNTENQMVHPELARQTQIEMDAMRPTPYDMFSQMLIPALTQSAKKTAIAQSYASMARIAIALERHHLAHASYPETLDALAPQFIAKLPHDVINGQPLKYRRTETGGFILYSVGWNEKDDGGTVVMGSGKTPSVDQTQGDWVWASEAK